MAKIMFDENIYVLAEVTDIRLQKINWNVYLQSEVITEEEFFCIRDLDRHRNDYFKINPGKCVSTLLLLLTEITKDITLQYLLIMIHDLMVENNKIVGIFHKYANEKNLDVWKPFFNILENPPDDITIEFVISTVTKLACFSSTTMVDENAYFFLNFLRNMIIKDVVKVLKTAVRSLQFMLRKDVYRFIFVEIDGVTTLVTILSSRTSYQVQYQLIFCLWVLTFNTTLAARICKFQIIPILADILHDCAKDKVVRIIFGFFRNSIEKPVDENVIKEHCMMLIQCRVMKQVIILEKRNYDDEELIENVEYVGNILKEYLKKSSSFDEYSMELRSGQLEWSPVHKSAKFWAENVQHLNDNNYEMLRILVHLLETSRETVTLSVACFDIGEYVRHYPRGKNVVEHLGAKKIIMQFLGHSHASVRYEALVAVQKLMLHN